MNREEAREYFKRKGLDYTVLNFENIKKLVALINDRMKESECYNGDYECDRIDSAVREDKQLYFLWCRSSNWDKRECISFNDDGFIGFAGWADNTNIVPIIQGFVDWCDLIAA